MWLQLVALAVLPSTGGEERADEQPAGAWPRASPRPAPPACRRGWRGTAPEWRVPHRSCRGRTAPRSSRRAPRTGKRSCSSQARPYRSPCGAISVPRRRRHAAPARRGAGRCRNRIERRAHAGRPQRRLGLHHPRLRLNPGQPLRIQPHPRLASARRLLLSLPCIDGLLLVACIQTLTPRNRLGPLSRSACGSALSLAAPAAPHLSPPILGERIYGRWTTHTARPRRLSERRAGKGTRPTPSSPHRFRRCSSLCRPAVCVVRSP